MLLCLQVCDT